MLFASVDGRIGGRYDWTTTMSGIILLTVADVAQILFPLVLAAATIAYTYFTYIQVAEKRIDRRSRNRPIIKGGLRGLGGEYFTFELHNTGNGAAHDLHSIVFFKEVPDSPIQFKTPTFPANSKTHLTIPFDSYDYTINIDGSEIKDALKEKNSRGELIIESSFEDIFGNRYSEEHRINTFEILEHQTQNDGRSEIEKVSKELRKINQTLSSLSTNIFR